MDQPGPSYGGPAGDHPLTHQSPPHSSFALPLSHFALAFRPEWQPLGPHHARVTQCRHRHALATAMGPTRRSLAPTTAIHHRHGAHRLPQSSLLASRHAVRRSNLAQNQTGHPPPSRRVRDSFFSLAGPLGSATRIGTQKPGRVARRPAAAPQKPTQPKKTQKPSRRTRTTSRISRDP